MYTGIQHVLSETGIFCHQFEYIDDLKDMKISGLSKEDQSDVSPETHEAYMSLLGAVAWTVLTRGMLISLWSSVSCDKARGCFKTHVFWPKVPGLI